MEKLSNQFSNETSCKFAADGVACIENAFTPKEVAIFNDVFEYLANHPTSKRIDFQGDENSKFFTDLTNFDQWETPLFRRMWEETKVADIALAYAGGQNLWFYYEQIWYKRGTSRRTPWHQDTPYLPVEGNNFIRFWIPLNDFPEECQLEYVRGSHKGLMYAPSKFDPEDETLALFMTDDMQPLPDIQADREAWDIVRWDARPGDLLMFHPSTLHGGGATSGNVERRSLALVFIGDDTKYVHRPFLDGTDRKMIEGQPMTPEQLAILKPGDPFRLPLFPKVR